MSKVPYKLYADAFGTGLITAAEAVKLFGHSMSWVDEARSGDAVEPVTREEMQYVYESLGVRLPPPAICKHQSRRSLSIGLDQCDDCHKTFPTPVSNRRRRR